MCVPIRLYIWLMAEYVEALDLGVSWHPNDPDAILLTGDSEPTVLALHAHPGDADRRCVDQSTSRVELQRTTIHSDCAGNHQAGRNDSDRLAEDRVHSR